MVARRIITGDSRNELKSLADCSVDSIVTDPPYELGFMGKTWDRSGIAYNVDLWRECLRVLKPGGHLLAFGGSRTYHRMACAIEDAGFEIRDQIQWIYGSGFPKSLDVSKAIDALAGKARSGTGEMVRGGCRAARDGGELVGSRTVEIEKWKELTIPATDAAKQWDGWGTALKPAHEPIVLARKVFTSTVAENVLRFGTGALNVDGCRIEGADGDGHWSGDDGSDRTSRPGYDGGFTAGGQKANGRWPANVIHDGSEEVLAEFAKCGERTSGSLTGQPRGENRIYGSAANTLGTPRFYQGDSGSAARFFYCAKASQEDRSEGLEETVRRQRDESRKEGNPGGDNPRNRGLAPRANHHPTVKPTDLMRYLCRLVTPPNGIVLDPFMGSGSTGKAAILEGLNFIGIELSAEYCELAQKRIEAVTRQGQLFGAEAIACPQPHQHARFPSGTT